MRILPSVVYRLPFIVWCFRFEQGLVAHVGAGEVGDQGDTPGAPMLGTMRLSRF
jgi:hypothetical protein